MVIICTNYDKQESQILHTKFRGHRPAGSGEDFGRVFTIYGRGGHFGHVTWTIHINFRSPFPRRLHLKFGFCCQAVLEEKIFEKSGRTDGRQTDAGSMGIP